jgi:GST-like protein
VIKVYAFSTPNSVRGPIALEELELPYEIEAINLRKGEQKQPSYLAINPNGKVPVLVDPDGPAGEPYLDRVRGRS